MSCTRVRRSLWSYADSELGPEASFEMEQHLARCAACRQRLARERGLEAALRTALGCPEATDRAAWDRALDAVVPGAHPWAERLAWAAIGAAAASGAIAVVFAAQPAPVPRDRGAALAVQAEPGAAPATPPDAPPAAPADLAAPAPALRPEDLEAMKPTTLLGAAVLASVTSAAATSWVLAPEPVPEDGGPAAATPGGLDGLLRRQAELEATIAELRAEIEARSPVPQGGERVPVIDPADIEAAVARAFEERGLPLTPAASPGLDPRLLRDLLAASLDPEERERIWRSIRDSGAIDAYVAEFERRAEQNPFDSMAQAELGWAYHQKMATTSGGPEAGAWGRRGAEAYQAALALDETNWDARRSLAEHYHWAGMRGDAIRELETLLAQQPGRASEAKHASAYTWLGNIYMDDGQREEALRVWNAGLGLFPADAALLERLAAFD